MIIKWHKESDKQTDQQYWSHTREIIEKKMSKVVVFVHASNHSTQEAQACVFLLWNKLFVHYEYMY